MSRGKDTRPRVLSSAPQGKGLVVEIVSLSSLEACKQEWVNGDRDVRGAFVLALGCSRDPSATVAHLCTMSLIKASSHPPHLPFREHTGDR